MIVDLKLPWRVKEPTRGEVREIYQLILTLLLTSPCWAQLPITGELGSRAQLRIVKGEYRTGPIRVPDNCVLTIEDGTTITADVEKFTEPNDRLFDLFGSSNVTVRGEGLVRIVMPKDEFLAHDPATEQGHVFGIRGGSWIVISNLTIIGGEGDAVYVGVLVKDNQRIPSSMVVLTNLVISGYYRNGISITSVNGLTVNDVLIHDTTGTAVTSPKAAIDIEPASPKDTLLGILIDNVTSDNNPADVGINLHRFDGQQVEIKFRDCAFRNAFGNSIGFQVPAEPLTGLITFENCEIVGTSKHPIIRKEFTDPPFEMTFSGGLKLGDE